jgi:amidase
MPLYVSDGLFEGGSSYGFDKWEAYLLLTQVGKVRLGNMVDPNYTIGASIAREYLT